MDEKIHHYEKKIIKIETEENYSYCLAKLAKLPITVKELKNTRVFQSVKRIVKKSPNSDAGIEATKLLKRWSAILAAHETMKKSHCNHTENHSQLESHHRSSSENIVEKKSSRKSLLDRSTYGDTWTASVPSKIRPLDELIGDVTQESQEQNSFDEERQEPFHESPFYENKLTPNGSDRAKSEEKEKQKREHAHRKDGKKDSKCKDKHKSEEVNLFVEESKPKKKKKVDSSPIQAKELRQKEYEMTEKMKTKDYEAISESMPSTSYKQSAPLPPTIERKMGEKKEDKGASLEMILSQKGKIGKVFSGKKNYANQQIPSLLKLCQHVLEANLDMLEYTGGIPYDLLKNILEKATADQLLQIEQFNPYLLEDTDELWRVICHQQFRKSTPDDCETWRDVYFRCFDEREAKFASLANKLSSKAKHAAPVRQTKLAFVESAFSVCRTVQRSVTFDRHKFFSSPWRYDQGDEGDTEDLSQAGMFECFESMNIRFFQGPCLGSVKEYGADDNQKGIRGLRKNPQFQY
nr:EOG090X0BTZ [Artemia franciscana]